MVIRDLSQPQVVATKPSADAASLPMGTVTDRFVALILDFLIFSPVVSFFVAGLLRDLKTLLILDADSTEANIIWLVVMLTVMAVTCALQALFLYFWQATPGQKFMHLQVVSFPQWLNDRKTLSFSQALMRAFGWWFGVFTFGIPFLEILAHPLRRAFHERLSDTMVISLKREKSDVPLAIESRYIGSTMWVFFGFLLVLGFVLMIRAYRGAVVEGFLPGKTYGQASCQDIPEENYKDERRLDMAIALYLSEDTDEACVYSEAQKVLWLADGEAKALAQVGMGLINEDIKESRAYYNKACETSQQSEACFMAKYLLRTDSDRGQVLRMAGYGLISSKVLAAREAILQKQYSVAAGLLRDLDEEGPLKAFLDKSWVKIAWAVNLQQKQGGRKPAGFEDSKIIEEFKERYQIQ